MKALVVYDSQHGNTEAIARAIAGAAPRGAARAIRVGNVNAADLKSVDTLAVGSPTLGGRPTPAIQRFLDGIPAGSLAQVRVAAFDTRMSMFIAKLFGWAADRISTGLKAKGGLPAAKPEGFIVKGRDGPLADGERERAAVWAKGFLG
ncbi:MAG: flavodoxin domain-containing protein [Spirochaetes bacterium]|nr:flavodoxin domain-containing protein [Spirochaetota bacterium]